MYTVGGLSAYFVSLSCLDEQEFAAVVPAMAMTLEDRDGLKCPQDRRGGPEGLADSLASVETSDGLNVLIQAATECGLSPGARP